MEIVWKMIEYLVALATISASLLFSPILFEVFRRRHNYRHVHSPAVFEDPNSLNQVPCPHVNDPPQKYISLIIPAFNEEHRLPVALDETLNYLQQRAEKDKSFTYEVVIVDDGSSDGTKTKAFSYVRNHTIDNIRVILLGKNHGKGEAIRKGMLHSRGELLLMLDADGATKVYDLEKLENQILAVAKEKCLYSDVRISDIPIAAFGSRVHDNKALATCGFKMFTRAAARKIFTNIRLRRWCFDVEIVYLCKQLGIPMIETSVNWSEIPGSKVKPSSIVNVAWELVLVFVGYRTGLWRIYK